MTLELGAFARIWKRDSAEAIARAMADETLTVAQWNFSALGQPTVSADRGVEEYERVRAAFSSAGIDVWGLSASFNLIEPDPELRERLIAGVRHMVGVAEHLGATAVTILTGSRSEDGFSFDPLNRDRSSWDEMLRGLAPILEAASAAGVLIGVEPEGGNVVRDAECGLALFDEFGADAPIGFIIDPWNLVEGDLMDGARGRPADEVVTEAFQLLGPRAICVQAKDPIGAEYPQFGLDYDLVAGCHLRETPGVPVVIQDVAERDIPHAVRMLRDAWTRAGG